MKKVCFLIFLALYCATLVEGVSIDFQLRADYPDDATCVYCDVNGCYDCDTTTAAPDTTTPGPDDPLTCWAINGWADREGMDQWCMDNCFNPGAPFCPSTTSDGGGCDCNCNAGDDGCPLTDEATSRLQHHHHHHHHHNHTDAGDEDYELEATLDDDISGNHHDAPVPTLTCWAINGWANLYGMDAWCSDNCHYSPPNCPSNTEDGGGCDCNCDIGDEGCPLTDEETVRLQHHNPTDAMVVNDKNCPFEFDCGSDLGQVLEACEVDPRVINTDSMMGCIAAKTSEDCYDCVCEAYADIGYNCP